VEGDLLVPRLRIRADDDLPVRHLGQHPQPCCNVSSTMPLDTPGRNGSPRSVAGIARIQKMTFTSGEAWMSIDVAAANVPDTRPIRALLHELATNGCMRLSLRNGRSPLRAAVAGPDATGR
jgi:hypothetical protein